MPAMDTDPCQQVPSGMCAEPAVAAVWGRNEMWVSLALALWALHSRGTLWVNQKGMGLEVGLAERRRNLFSSYNSLKIK